MTEPLVQKLQYNDMTNWGDKIILGTAIGNSITNPRTQKFLEHLISVTVSLPEKAAPIIFRDYVK